MSGGHLRLRPCRMRGFLAVLVLGTVLCCAIGTAAAQGPWLPENISTIGKQIDHLYRVIFGLTFVMLVLTEGALIFFIIRYRPPAPQALETAPVSAA